MKSFWNILLVNAILMILWHYSMFLACISLKKSSMDPKRPMFQPKEWEKGGKWYSKYLKINLWKDLLPQHVGKGGFSKEHLTDLTVEYLDEFIMETCRGEWDHRMCCLYCIISFIVNPVLYNFQVALIFALLALIINLPFVAIQRDNRFRLQVLRKRLLREQARNLSGNKVMVNG